MNQNKTEVFQELIKRQPDFLERPLEELLPMRFMGEVAVNAYRGLIKRLDDLPLSIEEKESRLRDGQDAGKALLAIETRIGELLPSVEEVQRTGKGGSRRQPDGSLRRGGSQRVLPEGIKTHQAQRARAIASHPKEVEEVIKEAEENEDIPTKTAVLNKIAYKREKERAKDKREKTQVEMRGNAYLYYTKLEEAFHIIPPKPPSDLIERDYLAIKAMALTIIKKLEVFYDGQEIKSLSR